MMLLKKQNQDAVKGASCPIKDEVKTTFKCVQY